MSIYCANASTAGPVSDRSPVTRRELVRTGWSHTLGLVGATALLVACSPPGQAPSPQVSSETAPPLCGPSVVTLTMGRGGAAMGTSYQRVVITNTSGTPCELAGFPTVSFSGGSLARSIAATKSRDIRAAPRGIVGTAPAHFTIEVPNPLGGLPTRSCHAGHPDVVTVRIMPGLPTTTMPFHDEICTTLGRPSVTAYRRGNPPAGL
jgi:hypothetical protein